MVRTLWLLLVVFGCLAGSTGCSPKTPSAGSAEKPKVEAALAFTDLLQEEYDKLKIKTQAAAVEDDDERLILTGWIMAKPGHEVTLTAPSAGYVKITKGKSFPSAGDPVDPEKELVLLEPVLSPAEKIQADALERSIVIMSTLVGALLLSRSVESPELAQQILDVTRDHLKQSGA